MLKTAIDQLTREQREKLHEFGVDSALLSRWRTGKRLPTEPQAVFLAKLTGCELEALRDEIALLRATPEQRRLLESVLGKLKGGAVAMLFCGIAVAASVGWTLPGAERLFSFLRLSPMYRCQNARTELRLRCTTGVL